MTLLSARTIAKGKIPLADATPRSRRARRLGEIPTCAGLMTRLAFAHAQTAGYDVRPLLRRSGLSLRDIKDGSIPIAVSAQIGFVNGVAEALNDRLLGFHIARAMDLRSTGFLYYVAASSNTLGEALMKIGRYSSIVNEGVAVTVRRGAAMRVVIDYAGVSRHADRHQIEAWMTAVMRFCRDMTGRALLPLDVGIMHERIPESDEVDAFFGRAVEFGARLDEILLPSDVAQSAITSSDPYLNRLLIEYCDDAVSRRSHVAGTLRADVENALAALLPHGQASIENVAGKLGISSRTLRRRLAAEATSFTAVLKDLRLALAKRYLAEQSISISRIAWLLGYAEVSTFSHAFRRWTGRPPRVMRAAA
jgi:AraC-like DNA-binding protein